MGLPMPSLVPARATADGGVTLPDGIVPSPPPCQHCDVVREVALCAALSREEFERLASARCHAEVPAGMAVFREGDPADHVYSVSSGAVKLYKLLSDGRRQIIGFLFAGDVFGLGVDGGYAYTAETLTVSHLCRFSHRKFAALMGEMPRLERNMLSMAVKDLAAAQEQMLLLGRKTAREKLATFLLRLMRRERERGLPALHLDLPMSRADIADHLGLTIETVSRVFTRLKREGVIGLSGHGQVLITDAAALERAAEGAAGPF